MNEDKTDETAKLPPRAVVVPGSSPAYRDFIKENGLDPKNYPCILYSWHIRGYKDIPVLLVGCWVKVDDIEYIKAYAQQHNMDVIEKM